MIKVHIEYLKYLMIHKYWVYIIGRMFGLSRWQLITHDLSKFLPSEWFGYARWKHEQLKDPNGGSIRNDREFGWPWFLHMHKRCRHHWQYWIYVADSGQISPIEMQEPYRTEMLVDWIAAGITRFGKPGLLRYYDLNKDIIHLGPETRKWLESQLETSEQLVCEAYGFEIRG